MKTKKSIAKRLKMTRRGKIRRRATSLGHSRANKRGTQLGRKKRERNLKLPKQVTIKYIQ